MKSDTTTEHRDGSRRTVGTAETMGAAMAKADARAKIRASMLVS